MRLGYQIVSCTLKGEALWLATITKGWASERPVVSIDDGRSRHQCIAPWLASRGTATAPQIAVSCNDRPSVNDCGFHPIFHLCEETLDSPCKCLLPHSLAYLWLCRPLVGGTTR